jgi:hypothetical protein
LIRLSYFDVLLTIKAIDFGVHLATNSKNFLVRPASSKGNKLTHSTSTFQNFSSLFHRLRSSRFLRFPFSHAWYRTFGPLEPTRFLQRALNVEKEPFTSKQKTKKRIKRSRDSEVNNLLIY